MWVSRYLYVYACAYARMHVYVRASVCARARVFVYTCMNACMHERVPAVTCIACYHACMYASHVCVDVRVQLYVYTRCDDPSFLTRSSSSSIRLQAASASSALFFIVSSDAVWK